MARILVISPVASHPPFGGNKQRIAAMTDALEAGGHEVSFLFAPFQREPVSPALAARWGSRLYLLENPAPVARVADGVEKSAGNRPLDSWYPSSLDDCVDEICRSQTFDAVMVEYVAYSKVLERFAPSTRRIIDTHDRFTDRYLALRGYATDVLPWPWSDMSLSREEESRGLQRADAVIAIQGTEAEYFRSLGARLVFEVGHLVAGVRLPVRRPPCGKMLFVGSGWQPNVEGALWFIDRILPRLRDLIPGATLHVAGRVATRLAPGPGVVLEGLVDDLAELYEKVDIVINPVTHGTGLAIKSVEALAQGRPLVAFPNGARGLQDAVGHGITTARSEPEWLEVLAGLLKDPDAWYQSAFAAAAISQALHVRNLQNLEHAVMVTADPDGSGGERVHIMKPNEAVIARKDEGARRKVVFFGASSLGERAMKDLGHDREVVAYVDNDRAKWGKEFAGRPVVSPDRLREMAGVSVVVTSSYWREISSQLEKMGIVAFEIFTPDGTIIPSNPATRARKPDLIDQIGKIRTNFGQTLGLLRKLGHLPGTVVDVGVAFGTPELYEPFPDAELVLVEPLEEFRPHMDAIVAGRKKTRMMVAAAGDKEGEIEISVTPDKSTSSVLPLGGSQRRRVPVVRVDVLCQRLGLPGPYVIKVDVQGFELTVMDGCTALLANTLAVVLEVSFLGNPEQGTPQFFEVLSYMKERGFVAYDVVGGHNRPLDGARCQADVVFVQENGPLRRDTRWATPEQVQSFIEAKRSRPQFRAIMGGV